MAEKLRTLDIPETYLLTPSRQELTWPYLNQCKVSCNASSADNLTGEAQELHPLIPSEPKHLLVVS